MVLSKVEIDKQPSHKRKVLLKKLKNYKQGLAKQRSKARTKVTKGTKRVIPKKKSKNKKSKSKKPKKGKKKK